MEGPATTDSLTAIIDRVLYNGISDDRSEVVQAVLDLIPDAERDERLPEAVDTILPDSIRGARAQAARKAEGEVIGDARDGDDLAGIVHRVLASTPTNKRPKVVQAVLDLIPNEERDERLREAIEMMLPSSERIAETFQDARLRAELDPDDTGEVLGGDTVVHVRRQWNDVDGGRVRLRDLSGWQYTDQVGSTYNSRGRSPQPMLHAYALCSDIDGLEISHTCRHGPPPHRIKVVIVAKDNSKQVMAHLRDLSRATAYRYL